MARGIILPIEIPVIFPNLGGVTLPIRIPLTFPKYGVTLPIKLPMTFSSGSNRKSIKIPTNESCEFSTERKLVKIPTELISSITSIKMPTSETGWYFNGLIMEEYIVDKMTNSIAMVEEIRSRILVNIELIDRNHISLNWYGDEVPTLDILIKSFVDDDYEVYSSHNWSDEKAIIQISDQDYQIMIMGKNGTGESSIIELNTSDYMDVFSEIDISLNEKIYDIDIDLVGEYHIDVNL